MNIEHRTTPIEHWIVDGKAYRLATEADIGKDCYFADAILARMRNGIHGCLYGKLTRINSDSTDKYWSGGTCWLFALIEDDSLLAPQRTPVPALGDGWYLLTAEDGGFQEGDKITSCEITSGWIDKSIPTYVSIANWLSWSDTCYAARYFGAAKPEPVTKPIDWTKPVRTKTHKKSVRIVCTDGPGEYPVIGIVENDVDFWDLQGNLADDAEGYWSLENAPQRIQREYWGNVYADNIYIYSDKPIADYSAVNGRIACVKITIDCEEGEGL